MFRTETADIIDDNLCLNSMNDFKSKSKSREISINTLSNNGFLRLNSSNQNFPVKTEFNNKNSNLNNYKSLSKNNNSTIQLKKNLNRTEKLFRINAKSKQKANIISDIINLNKKNFNTKKNEDKFNLVEDRNSSRNLFLLNSTLNSSNFSSKHSFKNILSSNKIPSYSHKFLKNTKKNLCEIYFKCLNDIKNFENIKQFQENSIKSEENYNLKKINDALNKINFMSQLFQENKSRNFNEDKKSSYDVKKNNKTKLFKKNLKQNYNLAMTTVEQNLIDKKKLIRKLDIFQKKTDKLLNYEAFIKKMNENKKLILANKDKKYFLKIENKLPKITEKA